jgi:hypothetical protein
MAHRERGVGLRSMPAALRSGPYRVYFFSHEPNEPSQMHVDRDAKSAKFWLSPVSLARNFGFSAVELTRVRNLLEENRELLLESWNEWFGE